MKVAAIYVRKSIRTKKGESIKSQIDMCREYAKDNDISVSDSLIYYDEGYSGKDINRPKFKQMLNDLSKNDFDVLLCYRLDRISRSINDFSNLINLLKKHDVSFISIKEQFDTSTAMGKSMMYIASVFSELERETISERIRDNLNSLARSGRWLGGTCPTGFESRVTTLIDKDLNERKIYKLCPVDLELTLIKTLFELFLRFKDLSILEDYCIKNSIQSKNNYTFTQTSLKQILVNPVYCIADEYLYYYLSSKGFTISNKRSEFTGKFGVLLYNINEESIISLGRHSGIIESVDWISVQMIISRNSKLPSRQGTSSIGLLSGLVYCSICSSLMRVKYGRKTNTGISYYYLCTSKEKSKDNCNSLNLKGDYIDKMFFQEIKKLIKPKTFISNLLNYIVLDKDYMKDFEALNNASNLSSDIDDELSSLNKRLKTLKYQLNSNINSPSHAYILEQIQLIDRQIIIIKEPLRENYNEPQNVGILNHFFHSLEQILYDFDISILTFREKQSLINQIVTSLYWDNRKIIINFI